MKITSAKFARATTAAESFPGDGRAEVAFIGRSNVGKSSLINSLLGVKGLARTSNTPGRTQSINFFLINESFYFVDLPGYGYARVSKSTRQSWRHLIENYLADRPQIVLSVLIVDARHEPSPLDLQMQSWLRHFGLPSVVVSTKIDKLSGNEQRKMRERMGKVHGPDRIIPYSAVTRDGTRELWEVIQMSLKGESASAQASRQ